MYAEIVEVNLVKVRSKQDLLDCLDTVFEFGGPQSDNKGWGKNWDALRDSFQSLSEGGIWSTSHIFQFPLLVTFRSCKTYQDNDPEGYAILGEILQDTKRFYESYGLQFDYSLS